jgi:hypothetical protein
MSSSGFSQAGDEQRVQRVLADVLHGGVGQD